MSSHPSVCEETLNTFDFDFARDMEAHPRWGVFDVYCFQIESRRHYEWDLFKRRMEVADEAAKKSLIEKEATITLHNWDHMCEKWLQLARCIVECWGEPREFAEVVNEYSIDGVIF